MVFCLQYSYDGFYLFTYWSSKQTEPINLPDNRCLTFGFTGAKIRLFFHLTINYLSYFKTTCRYVAADVPLCRMLM